MSSAKEVVYSAAVAAIAVSGWAGMLHFYVKFETAHQANVSIARGVAAECRPQRVGQSATYLISPEGRVYCEFTDHGVPRDVWLNFMKKRGVKS